mmetsp:Transcript_11540/g.37930  ORF Transcript_11540/g.37930 Transcript_11540/m.37930 type:complete len:204 (+) Transcript_11540:281-892(+)
MVGGFADEGFDPGSPGEAEDALEAPEGDDGVVVDDVEVEEVAAAASGVEEARERVGELPRRPDGHVGVRGVEERLVGVEAKVHAARRVVVPLGELQSDVRGHRADGPALPLLTPKPPRVPRRRRQGQALVAGRQKVDDRVPGLEDVRRPPPEERTPNLLHLRRRRTQTPLQRTQRRLVEPHRRRQQRQPHRQRPHGRCWHSVS